MGTEPRNGIMYHRLGCGEGVNVAALAKGEKQSVQYRDRRPDLREYDFIRSSWRSLRKTHPRPLIRSGPHGRASASSVLNAFELAPQKFCLGRRATRLEKGLKETYEFFRDQKRPLASKNHETEESHQALGLGTLVRPQQAVRGENYFH